MDIGAPNVHISRKLVYLLDPLIPSIHVEIPGFQDAKKSKEGILFVSILLLRYFGAKRTPLWLENFTTATKAGWLRVSRHREGR